MTSNLSTIRIRFVGCVGLTLSLALAGCVTDSLPQTDTALADFIQSAAPSDDSASRDDSTGRVDDSSSSSTDDSASRAPGADDSSGSTSSDDLSGSPDDSASPADDGASASSSEFTGSDQRLRAGLSGAGAESGNADYRVESGRRKFSVEVEDFAPGDYAVRVNGVEVAVISVGSLGTAEIEFDSKIEAGHTPFPAAFPNDIQIGDVVERHQRVDQVESGAR